MMDLLAVLGEFSQLSSRSAFLSLLACLLLMFFLRRSGQRQLPGPWPWPLIGNAAQLGTSPHFYFTRMAQKYGDVFQIKLGSRTVVVLNGEAIKEALIKKAVDFAGRPDFASFRFVSDGKSLAFGNYSQWWKLHRKVAHSTVRTFSTANIHTKQTFEKHIVSEIRELIHLFLNKTREQKYFEPHSYLVVSVANIMSAVCFGNRYSYDDAEFQQVVGRNDQFTKTVGAGSIVDVMPWLQYFPNPIKTLFGQFKELNKEFNVFINSKVVEHRKTFSLSLIRDMTDAFIIALDKGLSGGPGVFLGKEFVPPTIADIFGASQDTLSTALQWIILLLIRYPEVQKRLQEDIDRVADRSRLPTIADQPHLPYIMAFIYEVMRFTSFVPVTIPHSTTTDTSINGYPIPKDTVIFINQWSLNHDPNKWDQPEVFNPERFLDEDGTLNKDLTTNVLIFSVGKRRCIGEDLSKIQLFLFTSLLVHQCNFTVERTPSMDYIYGLTLKPNAFKVAVTLRDNAELLENLEGASQTPTQKRQRPQV
ncbi:cytochrome P450 1B1 [Myxocyprinus asiaticus]|uniref:cytochrome P450 1B1 n=1 Tax=Myxocyprinus asiaticus TaxID=70543 RepID=UPI00222392F6|nr:cytochrome P450 1B1 [Myxocyprinus asiaticus]XP_051503673.1 cytochrome P450 1B1 [Myxocyprinus asiaticus]